jgi:hypothetical protein
MPGSIPRVQLGLSTFAFHEPSAHRLHHQQDLDAKIQQPTQTDQMAFAIEIGRTQREGLSISPCVLF